MFNRVEEIMDRVEDRGTATFTVSKSNGYSKYDSISKEAKRRGYEVELVDENLDEETYEVVDESFEEETL